MSATTAVEAGFVVADCVFVGVAEDGVVVVMGVVVVGVADVVEGEFTHLLACYGVCWCVCRCCWCVSGGGCVCCV